MTDDRLQKLSTTQKN